MTKVFIGGSRRVTRLNADVQRRIDKIIEQGFAILVGDANGADKAVQTYLRTRRYNKVDVFCTAVTAETMSVTGRSGQCRHRLEAGALTITP